jgi:hypothetical protein
LTLFPNFFDDLTADQAIESGPGGDGLGIDLFVADVRFMILPDSERGFEPPPIVFFETIAPGFGLPSPLAGIVGIDPGEFEFWFVVRATALVAHARSSDNRLS